MFSTFQTRDRFQTFSRADFNNGKQNTSIDYKKFIAWLMLSLSTFDIYIK